MPDVFRLENVSAGYGKTAVLKNISIAIAAGEFAAVIGPNGAGKSTLLKTLAKILPAAGGNILLNEKSIAKLSAKDAARQFSFVSQTFEPTADFTVREFVSLGLFPHQGALHIGHANETKHVSDGLKLCGAGYLANRKLSELSGGERQLVSIARAFVQNSKLMILDEPAAHLDIKHTLDIIDILKDLNKNGGTIIAALHDINLAVSICSRIIALKNGEIFFNGTPSEICTPHILSELFDVKCSVIRNSKTGMPFVWFDR